VIPIFESIIDVSFQRKHKLTGPCRGYFLCNKTYVMSLLFQLYSL